MSTSTSTNTKYQVSSTSTSTQASSMSMRQVQVWDLKTHIQVQVSKSQVQCKYSDLNYKYNYKYKYSDLKYKYKYFKLVGYSSTTRVQVQAPSTTCYYCYHLPSHRPGSLPFGQYQITLLDDKDRSVLTTCPQSYESGTVGTSHSQLFRRINRTTLLQTMSVSCPVPTSRMRVE